MAYKYKFNNINSNKKINNKMNKIFKIKELILIIDNKIFKMTLKTLINMIINNFMILNNNLIMMVKTINKILKIMI